MKHYLASSNKGFALPMAIFLIVVIAIALLTMNRLNSAQSSSSVLGIQGTRAYWAARSGIEWATHKVTTDVSCPGSSTLTGLDGSMSAFTVQITCAEENYKEGSSTQNISVFRIISEASYGGSPGSPDYVYRRVEAMLAIEI